MAIQTPYRINPTYSEGNGGSTSFSDFEGKYYPFADIVMSPERRGPNSMPERWAWHVIPGIRWKTLTREDFLVESGIFLQEAIHHLGNDFSVLTSLHLNDVAQRYFDIHFLMQQKYGPEVPDRVYRTLEQTDVLSHITTMPTGFGYGQYVHKSKVKPFMETVSSYMGQIQSDLGNRIIDMLEKKIPSKDRSHVLNEFHDMMTEYVGIIGDKDISTLTIESQEIVRRVTEAEEDRSNFVTRGFRREIAPLEEILAE